MAVFCAWLTNTICVIPDRQHDNYNNPPTLYWYLESYNSRATEYHVKYSKTGPGGYSYVLGHYDATEGYFTTSSINQYITIPFALTAGARYYWK